MDSDVIVSDLESYNVEAEKDLVVQEIESEQQLIEKGLKIESNNPDFFYIRKHFEELIEMYGDIRSLANLNIPADQLVIDLKSKAVIVEELRTFLQMIDQVNKVDEDARE